MHYSNNQPTTSKSPSHIAYRVRELEHCKSIWTRIGSGWSHKDGKGFTVQLDAVPLDGRITLRRPDEKATDQAQTSGRKSRTTQPDPV